MKNLLLILFFSIVSVQAQAECISASHVEEVAKIYSQFSGKGKLCDTEDPQSFAVVKTLLTMQAIHFPANAGRFDELSVPVIPDQWSKYLAAHVREFRFVSECADSRMLAYTAVRDANSSGVMFICPAFESQKGAGIYENIATLLHEARHLEFNVDHVTCLQGESVGVANACDSSMEQKGSYAVSIQSMAKMARPDSNLSPVARGSMRSSAILTAFERLNKAPKIDRVQKPLFITADGRLQVLLKDRMAAIANGLPDGVTAQYGSRMIVYPKADEAAVYIDAARLMRKDADRKSAITRNGKSESEENRLGTLGIHHGAQLSVRVKANSLTVVCNKNSAEISAGQSTLTGIVYPEGYSYYQSSVLVADDQDNWARVRCDAQNNPVFEWQRAAYTKLSRVMKAGSDVFGISRSGHLVQLVSRNGSRTWAVVNQAKSTRYRDLQSFEWIRFTDKLAD